MPPRRPAYAFDVEGHTVVVEETEYKKKTDNNLMSLGIVILIASTFATAAMMSIIVGIYDAMSYISAILAISIIGGITLQRIEDRRKERS